MDEYTRNALLVFAGFSVLMAALALWKPAVSRVVSGVFFLLMALGVNLPMLLTNPAIYVDAGASSPLGVYRWFFTTVLAWNPVLFVVALIAFELAVGLLILCGSGRWLRIGLILAIVFCLWVSWIGPSTLTSMLLAVTYALLLRHPFDRPVINLPFFSQGKPARA
jgi:hypothetical protein